MIVVMLFTKANGLMCKNYENCTACNLYAIDIKYIISVMAGQKRIINCFEMTKIVWYMLFFAAPIFAADYSTKPSG